MTNPELSNEVSNKQVIIWQYDHAPNLLALVDGFNQIATDTVTRFWDYFRDGVFNIETADDFGLNVLGRLMGLPRPTVELEDGSASDSASEIKPITDGLFRRLLKGRFFLFGMSPTVPNYNKYLSIIWGRLPWSCFPIEYRSGAAPAAQSTVISDPGSLAFIERTETYPDGSDSDSREETAKFLDVYDARNNTFLFTMSESSEGVYAYSSSNPDLTITFNGSAPSSSDESSAEDSSEDSGTVHVTTISRAHVIDGGAIIDSGDSDSDDSSLIPGDNSTSTLIDPNQPYANDSTPTLPDPNRPYPTLIDPNRPYATLRAANPMAMKFTEPTNPTPEESAMHTQHPDLIYFYPAGIRTNKPSPSSTKVIGTLKQKLENMADAFSWVEDDPTPAGGILAGNEKAKFLDGIVEDGNEGGGNG